MYKQISPARNVTVVFAVQKPIQSLATFRFALAASRPTTSALYLLARVEPGRVELARYHLHHSRPQVVQVRDCTRSAEGSRLTVGRPAPYPRTARRVGGMHANLGHCGTRRGEAWRGEARRGARVQRVCMCTHLLTRISVCAFPTDAANAAALLRPVPRETAVRTEPCCNALVLEFRLERSTTVRIAGTS